MVTRTTNPLHFEDLDPHRFEDLVRQLIYDFRNWLYLEALGRSGADDDIDIRGVERSFESAPMPEDEEDEMDEPIEHRVIGNEHSWFIQCKRHKELGPAEVSKILDDGPLSHEPRPYGYILAAACDFSKTSRDLFHATLAEAGFEEHHIWGRAELEDMLFLPKNDHLLFAYFGISHRIRRRSIKTLTRARLATKRRLAKVFDGILGEGFHMVMVRDPADDTYPWVGDPREFMANPLWRYWELQSHNPPDHVAFVTARYHAFMNWESLEWDIWEHYDAAFRPFPEIFGIDRELFDPGDLSTLLDAFVALRIPEENRAWVFELRPIHYDRILAVDDIGDVYNDAPHLLVDYLDGVGPFEPRKARFIEDRRSYSSRHISQEEGTRIRYFPEKLPDLREEWHKKLRENPGA